MYSYQWLVYFGVLLCWSNFGGTISVSASTISAPTQPLLPSTDNEDQLVDILNNRTSTFFNKFETRGPSLTLTLRDPSTVTLLSGSSSSSGITSKLWPSKRDVSATKKAPVIQDNDDGTFGIYSKLATIFHITPTSNNGQPQSTPSQFTDGYMLDDGEIFLDPPTTALSNGKSRGLFSIREMGNSILGNGWGRSLENVHPEIQYEMKTREQHSTTLNGNEEVVDTRPFPDSAPWLTGISCGMIWSPFPIYKTGYPEGYGHKLLSVPHYVRCGAKLSLPRVSSLVRQAWRQSVGVIRGKSADQQHLQQPFKATTRELNLGVTYQENPYQSDTGTVELLLGRSRSSIPPSAKLSTMKKSLLSDDDKYRRNNHFLVRLATGRSDKTNNKAATTVRNTLSSIEYIKGSFRMPTPSFMRNKGATRVLRGKGVSVSPSFDFVEGIPRCTVSGDVGKSGRTRAVLRVDIDDSTLTVVRALDENKIIAPTISLNTGKIVYDYYFNLDGASNDQANRKVDSSLRAQVDPTKGIILKWTDGIKGGQGSCWVTECRVPLGTSAPSPLAADVRVGRRWVI